MVYRSEIDGLRGLAIASVVLYHSSSSVFSGGYTGVDIFFVISGYLITSAILSAHDSGNFSYADFYSRRARRILPALLAMLAVVTAACAIVMLPADLNEHAKLLIYTSVFGANFRLTGTPGYFNAAMEETPLLHMWSLAVEEQFYLIWPASILLLASRGRRALRYGLLASFVTSLIASEALLDMLPRSAFFHLPSRGFELIAGAILASNLIPQVRHRQPAELLAAAGLSLMIAPVFLYGRDIRFPGVAALPSVLGSALVIYAETGFRTVAGNVLRWRPLIATGLVSYSLYLWHWPVFAIPAYILMRPFTPIEVAACVSVSVLLAVLSWRFVERPLRHRSTHSGRERGKGRTRILVLTPAYLAVALTCALIATGSYIQKYRGLPSRFAEAVEPASGHGGQSHYVYGCADQKRGEGVSIVCRLNNSRPAAAANIVLWGDSHAMSYASAIAQAFGGGTAYMMLDCMPLLGADAVTASGQAVAPYCAEFRRVAWAAIETLEPKVVVLASRWTLSEDEPYGHEIRTNRFFVQATVGPRTRASSQAVFASELTRTVSQLTALGIKVVIVAQTPEIGVPVVRCFAVYRHLRLPTGRCARIERSEVERRQANVNRVLAGIADTDANVSVFWPMKATCDASWCYTERDGKTLYADGDHLSIAGADFMEAALRLALPAGFAAPP